MRRFIISQPWFPSSSPLSCFYHHQVTAQTANAPPSTTQIGAIHHPRHKSEQICHPQCRSDTDRSRSVTYDCESIENLVFYERFSHYRKDPTPKPPVNKTHIFKVLKDVFHSPLVCL